MPYQNPIVSIAQFALRILRRNVSLMVFGAKLNNHNIPEKTWLRTLPWDC